ncbi:hypothetical protein LD13_gp184 [Bacillus phage Bobb]|uniref:Uncharacterized protein n=1 Tax=Bacillus phage Bobb TaxID=1527469 RepID=A0A076GDJ0_9CAUD|nr:hypothetical protein LD13_gp184 [Bacillus phage Bobb]AII28085.1 hypothetical protein [Bacillus phage Bobb]
MVRKPMEDYYGAIVTKKQEKALNKLRDMYSSYLSLADYVEREWETWSKGASLHDEESQFIPLGELPLSYVIAAASSGEYSTVAKVEKVIKRFIEDNEISDPEVKKIIEQLEEEINKYDY